MDRSSLLQSVSGSRASAAAGLRFLRARLRRLRRAAAMNLRDSAACAVPRPRTSAASARDFAACPAPRPQAPAGRARRRLCFGWATRRRRCCCRTAESIRYLLSKRRQGLRGRQVRLPYFVRMRARSACSSGERALRTHVRKTTLACCFAALVHSKHASSFKPPWFWSDLGAQSPTSLVRYGL